jgi:hypothetical protein
MMREIGTLVPSSQESVEGSDFGLPGFVPRGYDETLEAPAEEAEPAQDCGVRAPGSQPLA